MHIWRIAHGNLPTKKKLSSQGLGSDICPICNRWNLNNRRASMGGIPWVVIFAIACSSFWHWRNLVLYEEDFALPNDPTSIILSLADQYWTAASHCTNDPIQHIAPFNVKWDPPPVDWIKLNTDGTAYGNPGNAGCGGILRDHKGEWIGGFTSHIGSCSALDAELWGILKGLAFTKKKGLNSIMVECDSKEAITLIDKAKSSGFSFNQFINRIIMLASDIGRVTFLHNFREANTCADWLAKFSLSSNVGLVELADPPSDLMRFIARDKLGISSCRVGLV
ncbi:ribonuclease H [Senna tora]|uniref:Ribonuclease H n=1 Tax=Senna tora TaxID=362788 RepID=A0A834T419_9FABA|nr:ribonuclease H [Senna tora]